MLYSSMRPITQMDMFRTPISNRYVYLDDIPSNKIGVTRYASGMSGSLFREGERPARICGYFYYNEPESSTYLSYSKSLTSFNKSTAVRYLLDSVNINDLSKPNAATYRRMGHSLNNTLEYIEHHISGVLPPDLMMNAAEYSDYTSTYIEYLQQTREPYMCTLDENNSDRKVYVGVKLELYAKEDRLDQDLCKLARALGYDIIILTRMVGSHQTVTEVLDTRPSSFDHLWFMV